MKTYLSISLFLWCVLSYAQNPEATPTPKMYLGHEVDPSPYRDDELEAIKKINAYKKKIMLQRQRLIKDGKTKPNKWDIKFVEDMKAKGEEIVVPDSIPAPDDSEGTTDTAQTAPISAEDEFNALKDKREKRNEELSRNAKKNQQTGDNVSPEVTPAPEATKELTEEEKKYVKEKEEFLKKFKKQN